MIPWFQFTAFSIGYIPVQVWGFFVALGMGVAMWILKKRARPYGFNSEKILDCALLTIIFGLVGARLFHVVFYELAFFIAHPIEIVKVWQGGMSSYGGFFGAVVGFFYGVKKNKIEKKDWGKLADLFAYAALFGWIIGRVGCFMIHDHLGAHTSCPLALKTPDGPRFDMALMEIIGLIPLAILFFVTRKKKFASGWHLAVLAVYYGVLRFFLDFYRATDIPGADARYFGLTPAHYFSMVMAVWGVWWLVKNRKK